MKAQGETRGKRMGRGRPRHLFGGRVRTSTVVLLVAFVAVWWLYDTYHPEPPDHQVPASDVVPPGYVPDPDYTWVPRTQVRAPADTSTPPPPTPTTTPTTPVTTTPPTPLSPEPPPLPLPSPFGTLPPLIPPEPGSPSPPTSPSPTPLTTPPQAPPG